MMFDPARTSRSYSVLASDYIQFLLLPGLAAKLAALAPKASLRVIPANPYRRLQMVVEREADFGDEFTTFHGDSGVGWQNRVQEEAVDVRSVAR